MYRPLLPLILALVSGAAYGQVPGASVQAPPAYRHNGGKRAAAAGGQAADEGVNRLAPIPTAPAFCFVGLINWDGTEQPVQSFLTGSEGNGIHTAAQSTSARGGIWIAGEKGKGLSLLKWIVGPDNSDLLSLDETGMVRIDEALLSRKAAAAPTASSSAALTSSMYILSNEGLLLVEQVASGSDRYLIQIGSKAPSRGGPVAVASVINLDDNYDQRINDHRPRGAKLPTELPPERFDDMIGINPSVVWFNMSSRRVIPQGIVLFHELAEAHAKVGLGLEYLPTTDMPGAHDIALERERRLQQQRPAIPGLSTAGYNVVINPAEEMRKYRTSMAVIIEKLKRQTGPETRVASGAGPMKGPARDSAVDAVSGASLAPVETHRP